MDAKSRIDLLRKELADHNHASYLLDKPKISDFEFDKLLEELIRLEKEYPDYFDPNSPSQRVGGAINKFFDTVPHDRVMLSLGILIQKKNYEILISVFKIITNSFLCL